MHALRGCVDSNCSYKYVHPIYADRILIHVQSSSSHSHKKRKEKKKQLVSRHLPATAGEALVLAVAVGVVLVRTVAPDVVFIVHFVGVLLRVVVGLDLVGLVQTLGLSELVGLGTGNTSQDLLGGGVADVLACRVKGTPVSQLRGYR